MYRLGIILGKEFYRKDINELILELSAFYEIVPIVRNLDEYNGMDWAKGMGKTRPIKTSSSAMRRLHKRLFRYFGALPASITNYRVVTYFGLANIGNPFKKEFAEKILLPLTISLPKFISFDQYLSKLPLYDHTDIEDIDYFLFFSQITEEELLAKLLHLKKKVIIYLYSWDHAAKLKNLPRKNAIYLTWSEEVKKDLSELNSIPSEQIEVVGATQFTEIFRYRKENLPHPKSDPAYIYFGFSTMYAPLIEQEMNFVAKLNNLIDDLGLALKIKVRTYPILENQSIYSSLTELAHVIVEETNRFTSLNIASYLHQKYDSLAEAAAFFHFGTTLGVECCFFDTPSFIVDYLPEAVSSSTSGWSLLNFVHQYQNEKYLLSTSYPNVIRSDEELRKVLVRIQDKQCPEYLPYNRHIASQFPLVSISTIAINIHEVLTASRTI